MFRSTAVAPHAERVEAGSQSIPVYRFNNQDAVIHYYGAYVQLSTRDTQGVVKDYLLSPRTFSLAWNVETERVQVGVEHRVSKPAGRWVDAPDDDVSRIGGPRRKVFSFMPDLPSEIVEEPIYKNNVTRTRKYTDKMFGSPIQVGDAVESFALDNKPSGNIQALTEHYMMIDDIYVPWSSGVTYTRA